MKPVKKDHYKCGNCGNDEIVLAGKTPKIMCITVVGNEHQWCPSCVFAIPAWRKHVNEDHLDGPKRKLEEVHNVNSPKHMEYLNEKTDELLTVPRQRKLMG